MRGVTRVRASPHSSLNKCSSISRKRVQQCRSLPNDTPEPKVSIIEDPSSTSVDGTAIEEENQEQIAKAAALVLSRAKAVLVEKLEEYESELEGLENAASRNFVYRATNAWTIRLLKRKREFVKSRIHTMDELAANVYSCSLDRRCTFMLKTSADLEEMKRVVSSTLEETMSDGLTAQQTAARATPNAKNVKYDLEVEKALGVTIPPVTWTVEDEARVLEDALWEAALVASKIEGASVQVERSYDCVKSCERMDAKESQVLTYEVGSWANEKLGMNLSADDVRNASEVSSRTIPLDTAIGALAAVIGSSISANFLMWLFGLTPSLDDTLHWKNMVPTNVDAVITLLLWSFPLVGVYGILGSLRAYQNDASPKGPIGTITQASAFAADTLQSADRVLKYASTSSVGDMRIQYFLSTVETVCVASPFLWGVLPGVVAKLGAPFGGFFLKGATVPRVIQVPFIALGVAAVCGMGNFFNSAMMDMVDRDEKRDDTKYVDSLLQVQSPLNVPGVKKTTIENGRINMSSELGSDQDTAELALLRATNDMASSEPMFAGDIISKVSKDPPTSITMDFLSAASEREFYSKQEWIQPTAVMLSSFYLCLEAQLTGEIAYAACTQILAILALDYMTRPWNRVSMAVRVVMDQPGGGRKLTASGPLLGSGMPTGGKDQQ